MNQVLYEDDDIRINDDGTVYVRDNDDGDDDDDDTLSGDDDESISGDDDDDDQLSGEDILGALLKRKKKNKKKRAQKTSLLDRLFAKKNKSGKSGSKKSGSTIVLPGALGVQAKNMNTAYTVVTGRQEYTAASAAQVAIRLQHDFYGRDITFVGSVAGALVTGIWFGDQQIWNTPDGVDVSVFSANNQLRETLKGARIKAGLDIRVTGSVPSAGAFAVVVTGLKPVLNPSC